MVVIIVFMLAAFGVPDANAAVGDLWLDINVGSKHTAASEYTYDGKTEDFNERNYGLGASYQFAEHFEATAGFFKNSYSKTSIYTGVKIKTDYSFGSLIVSPGITISGVTGYDDTEVNGGFIQPIAIFNVALSYDKARVVIGYVPIRAVFNEARADVITLQVGIKF